MITFQPLSMAVLQSNLSEHVCSLFTHGYSMTLPSAVLAKPVSLYGEDLSAS